MSGTWAQWFSYEWWSDIGVPSLGALGTIVVGAGAIAVAVSSNKVASTIANREHTLQERRDAADERENRAAFVALLTRWSDRVIDEIRATSILRRRGGDVRSEELKADVDARAAHFRDKNGQDLVAAIESLTTDARDGDLPSDSRHLEIIVDVRRAYLQSWIAHPDTWKELDNDARLTAEGWVMAAQFRGRYEQENRFVDRPDAS
ncbi:hypothetical protein [Frigoribacterium sp. PhB118]|uniref:hypothetical protein n=1 Tax=Frigoribacterium sp. PhB118 TaxID=2485175 RepID=UPI000F4AB3BB|nr:hypothetical protein [Frigoribacterium sp. PhB118]ROS52456.1 hypothetical protein EDF21_2331 [Frigoribacterium sp. PhB118]